MHVSIQMKITDFGKMHADKQFEFIEKHKIKSKSPKTALKLKNTIFHEFEQIETPIGATHNTEKRCNLAQLPLIRGFSDPPISTHSADYFGHLFVQNSRF